MLEGLLSCSPLLPPGFTAQAAWGFRDNSGTFTYEFNRVYGPTRRSRRGIDGRHLDEERSYWVVTWSVAGETEREQAHGRWISYAQARKLRGSRFSFARFSSLLDMRADLPDLLHTGIDPASSRLGKEPRPHRPTTRMDATGPHPIGSTPALRSPT